MKMDVEKIRSDFPALDQKVYGKDLAYLDNAATTHKPGPVIDKIVEFYSTINSNVHRGVHYLSRQSSIAYEEAREKVKDFINSPSEGEIVFTGGTTESINLVADSLGRNFIEKGDQIITTHLEHHSNIVPWQRLCKQKGAKLKFIPIENSGRLQLGDFKNLINEKTKLVAVGYVSSVLGAVNPVNEIIEIAHRYDIPVLVDGAQAPQHFPVDIEELDCDFFAFSGHKMYGGTGTGVLYGKKKWFEDMEPYQSGGGMVESVNMDKTTYEKFPLKFEAGTGNIAGILSLRAAIEYLEKIGLENIAGYEKEVLDYALDSVKEIDDVTVYGNPPRRCGVISFNLDDIHPEDVGKILDKMGIAVRTGRHCAEPLMNYYGIPGTVRASFGLYNTKEEVDRLVKGIKKAKDMLREK